MEEVDIEFEGGRAEISQEVEANERHFGLSGYSSVCRRLGKRPILVRHEIPGFVGNRLQFAVFREALHLLSEGVASAENGKLGAKSGAGIYDYPAGEVDRHLSRRDRVLLGFLDVLKREGIG